MRSDFSKCHWRGPRRRLSAFLEGHALHFLYGGEHAYLLRDYVQAIESAKLAIELRLTPLETGINLYPETGADVRRRIAAKLKLPWSRFVPSFVVSIVGYAHDRPGRLYTFVARKHAKPH
jgi:hypothetical protein